MQITQLAIEKIRTDGGTQPRESIDQAVVEDYAEQIKAGVEFPPAVIFYDGNDHWLGDGFHRRGGYESAGKSKMPVEIRQGTQRDAILFSVGANAAHGLRRTNADKRRGVIRLLEDTEWSKWSDREVAKRCGVGNKFVGDVRASLCSEHSEEESVTAEIRSEKPTERTYTTKHGTTATMNTARIGQSKPSVRLSSEGAQAEPDDGGVAVMDEPENISDPETDSAGEIDPDTGKPYPPGDDKWYANAKKQITNSPSFKASEFASLVCGAVISFRDQQIDPLKHSDKSTCEEAIGHVRSILHSMNELLREFETIRDKANENENRPARRKTG